ncbi:Uncharacterized protein HZ326_15518 [Fusarium oxysporum f. sp. albedinis]|nr:Uncharacterized protein HZ326_15518 [Fusarium oxysporum f. sp. albedinis]
MLYHDIACLGFDHGGFRHTRDLEQGLVMTSHVTTLHNVGSWHWLHESMTREPSYDLNDYISWPASLGFLPFIFVLSYITSNRQADSFPFNNCIISYNT